MTTPSARPTASNPSGSGYTVNESSTSNPTKEKTSSTRRSGRDRIMNVASDLFYRNGIVSVGVDRIIEDAGVAKATLYKNFRSKENLIDAYLEVQHQEISQALESIAMKNISAMEKVYAIFDFLQNRSVNPPYRGCPFVLAFAEFPHPSAIAHQWVQKHKGYVRSLFSQLAPQLVPHAAIDTMVEQLMVLYEGALITSAIHPGSAAIHHARNMVASIVRTHHSAPESSVPATAAPVSHALPVLTV